MGQDKALISIGQETLLQHTCRVAADFCEHVAVISPHADRYRGYLPNSVNLLPEGVLPDQAGAYQGPVVGVLQAIEILYQQNNWIDEAWFHHWLLVLACDLPNLSAEVLASWQPFVGKQPNPVMACLPRRQGRWEPLCGFYRINCRNSLRDYVDQGGRSFQGWLNHQTITQLPLSDESMLVNLNTPEDLQRWQDREYSNSQSG